MLMHMKWVVLMLIAAPAAAASLQEYKPLVTDLLLGAGMQGKAVAVSELTYADGHESTDGRIVADRLTTALAHSKVVRTIERSKIDQVMGELKLQRSGAVAPDSVSGIGALLGAGVVIVGTLTDMPQKRLAVNLRAVDVASGLIIAGADGTVRRNWITPRPEPEVVNTMPISLGTLLKHQEQPAAPAVEAAPTDQIKLGSGCNSDIYYEPDGTFIRRQIGTTGKGVPIHNEGLMWCNFVAYIDIVVRTKHQNLRSAWLAYKQANGL